MIRYLVDTNFYIANHRPSADIERFEAVRPGELLCRAEKNQRGAANLDRLEHLRAEASARACGKLRAQLEKKGQAISAYDLLIAAHSLSLDVILVTNNTKEFSRVRGLKLENWVA